MEKEHGHTEFIWGGLYKSHHHSKEVLSKKIKLILILKMLALHGLNSDLGLLTLPHVQVVFHLPDSWEGDLKAF